MAFDGALIKKESTQKSRVTWQSQNQNGVYML